MRDQVAHLHTELARRYAGKPQPAVERELEAADQAIALWQALWEQYSACLKPLLEGDPELAGVKAKILQRGLYVGKQLVIVHGLARRVPPPALWQELHAYYRLAEMLDCAVTAVSDDLMPHAVGMSCYSTYSHALLLGARRPVRDDRSRQIELADRWLGEWARKIFPYAQQRETEGPVIVVDLDSPAGAAARCQRRPRNPPAVDALRLSRQARHQRARPPEAPADRRQSGRAAARPRLQRRAVHGAARRISMRTGTRCRGAQRRRRARVDRALRRAACRRAYFRVGGRTFDRQDPLGRLSFQGAQHLQTLGALTDYDRDKEDAERNWPWERWQGATSGARPRFARVGAQRYRWFLDQLVVVRDDERTRLGYVTRVARRRRTSELALSLRLWPGAAAGDGGAPDCRSPVRGAADAGAPARRDARGQGPPRSLPPRTFNAEPPAALDRHGCRAQVPAHRLLQRGADFERVAFEETT